MPRVLSALSLCLLAVVFALSGCIENRRGHSREGARGKARAAEGEGEVVTAAQVDDSMSNLVGTDRLRAEYSPKDPHKGAKQPLVTIVEFSDFECPFCSKLATSLESVAARYPDDVR